jgi:GMP synthase-like glutamine amidotransferase
MSSTPILILQHGPLGPAGVLGEWLADRGLPTEVHAAWEDPVPEDPRRYAAIVSLGSESSAAATDVPWVTDEIGLLRRAAAEAVPMLGLCFGGQALSLALGGGVRTGEVPEVGWIAVETDAPDVVGPGPWLQWHYEVFEPPPGSTVVAHSPVGPACFRYGPHLGTQFHPEVTTAIVDGWAAAAPDELAGLGVRPEDLHDGGERYGAAAAEQARRLFDAWWAGAQG